MVPQAQTRPRHGDRKGEPYIMGKVLPSQRLLKQFEEQLVFGEMNLSEIVRSGAQMMLQYACAAVSAPSASDERCDSRLPHRRRRRRMRCQLWPMRWDCRSVRQAMQPAMNRGLFCSSARRRRLRQSARRHTDGACDSPCSFVLCAAGRRGQRDRCCRSRCATASSACLGRRGPYPVLCQNSALLK